MPVTDRRQRAGGRRAAARRESTPRGLARRRPLGGQRLVHAPGAEALQVNGDVQEPEASERVRHCAMQPALEQARQLGRAYLDARELLVVAHPYVAKAQVAQVLLGLVDA